MEPIQTSVFCGISADEWADIQTLSCVRRCAYDKDTIIFHAGEPVHTVGMVMAGSVHIENVDVWGNRSILSNIAVGELFAESYALCQEPMMVDVVAAEHCEILFLNLAVLLDNQNDGQTWYRKILANLLTISVQKNLVLSKRIFCTSPKTIRGRLLTYLSAVSVKCGSTSFQIPFDRQQLADYLNLDRSALSKELGKMRDDGILEFHKNHFTLLRPDRS